jgi:hypothetical protein
MQPVIDRRRDEEHARRRGRKEADEEDSMHQPGDGIEARAERRCQGEAEEELYAGQRDANLVEELGPLALEGLWRLFHSLHCTAGARFR